MQLQDMELVVYTPPIEEESDKIGWQKETVNFAMNNKSLICRFIRRNCKGRLQKSDVDDIYSELMLYLSSAQDYDINKAYSIDENGKESRVPIEGYISSCVKNCVRRFFSDHAKANKDVVSEVVVNDGKEMSLYDTVIDTSVAEDIEDLFLDIADTCQSCECIRYAYGVDIFTVAYISLLANLNGVQKVPILLNLLGMSKRELDNIRVASNSVFLDMIRALTKHGIKESIQFLEDNYVYSSSLIRKVLES